MKKTLKQSVRMSDVNFLVSTYDNRPGLERLLYSILEFYPGAQIVIADSSRQLDRAYYKQLRFDLADAGMLNRLLINHIAFKATQGLSFNELISKSKGKYRLLLTDEDVFTKDTDIEKMVRVMMSNKSIGVVGGSLNKETPEIDGRELSTDDGDTFGGTKVVNRFMLLFADVSLSVRFDPKAEDAALEFSNQAIKRLPFKMVTTKVILTSNKDFDNGEETNEQSDGESSGETPGSSVQTGAGGSDTEGGSADNGSPSRENEKSEDPAPSRRPSRGGTGSVSRKND